MVSVADAQRQRWWANLGTEHFWLESTDRLDIGVDLKAPLVDESMKPNWRYGLFLDAAIGDIVFHYDKKVSAISSVSRIAGEAEKAPIIWAARGTYARERGAVPSEVPGYRIPLADHRKLDTPVTLDDLRAARSELDTIYSSIPSTGARYFPFELSARAVRPLQGYAFKLPRSFVESFAGLSVAADGMKIEMRSQMDLFRDAVREIEEAAPRYEIGGLQALRALKKGLRRTSRSIFGNRAIEHSWLFHWGGREELQFNIGIDRFGDGTPAFRAGVAFSFEPSRSLPDIEVLVPKVARFNTYMREHPESFANLAMWHWQDGQRSEDYPAVAISDQLIRRHTFVFLGGRQQVDGIDPDIALRTLDQLYPLYQWVEGIDAPLPLPSKPHEDDAATVGLSALGPGREIDGGRWIQATSRERTLNVYLRHREMQRRLANELRRDGALSVILEASFGAYMIDAVAEFDKEVWFYEVKTASSARACLREAIGQLLEYALWPGATRPAKLVIVGEPPLDDEAAAYIEVLNARFPIPLAYRSLPLT